MTFKKNNQKDGINMMEKFIANDAFAKFLGIAILEYSKGYAKGNLKNKSVF